MLMAFCVLHSTRDGAFANVSMARGGKVPVRTVRVIVHG